ncbi:MAG TPA: hypothetical protein PKX82_02640 [Rhodoferax sp.]|nr:hypothetical protein [Rhodoferax sp.]
MKDRALWPVPMEIVGVVGWYLMRRGQIQPAIASLAVGMWMCVAVMVVVLAPRSSTSSRSSSSCWGGSPTRKRPS